jgi:hypothetical protein
MKLKKYQLKKEKIINQTNSDEPSKLKQMSNTHNPLNPRPELNQEA